ncbi:hypothetical protein ABW02_01495 [Niallia circulans]|uniref:Uncharacterized protein n=1 Tax=Niallia circulans TaxID=1397 RepID=A0A0J1IR57_NIACI|nr:hypothetical protein ABW02_01495 [Niallia circulans]
MKLMRHSRGLLVLMMFLSWFFLPLIGKDAVKRFFASRVIYSFDCHHRRYNCKKAKMVVVVRKNSSKAIWHCSFFMGPIFYWFLVDFKMDLRQILQIHFYKFSG